MAAKLKEIRVQLRKRMHARVPGTVKWLQQVVREYFQYHAIPGNFARLRAFRREMVRSWIKALRCRSQRHRMSWERFNARLAAASNRCPYRDSVNELLMRHRNRPSDASKLAAPAFQEREQRSLA
jgi:hypothetical protein